MDLIKLNIPKYNQKKKKIIFKILLIYIFNTIKKILNYYRRNG